MDDKIDSYLKIGGGGVLGIVALIVFGEYLWPVLATFTGVIGIMIAVALIVDGFSNLQL